MFIEILQDRVKKKADVTKNPEVIRHVGLLVTSPTTAYWRASRTVIQQHWNALQLATAFLSRVSLPLICVNAMRDCLTFEEGAWQVSANDYSVERTAATRKPEARLLKPGRRPQRFAETQLDAGLYQHPPRVTRVPKD